MDEAILFDSKIGKTHFHATATRSALHRGFDVTYTVNAREVSPTDFRILMEATRMDTAYGILDELGSVEARLSGIEDRLQSIANRASDDF